MERRRREQALLAGLLVVLALVGYRAWRGTAVAPRPASNRGAAARPARGQQARLEAPDVHLQALDQDVPAPEPGERDLFRFGARQAAPAEPAAGIARPPAPPPVTTGTAPAGASAPIGLKFIGLVGPADSDVRIAILSDGRGAPLFGQEGDVIAGQYRILHIGTESIEIAYLDGRGRQTIRLSGS